MRLHRTALIAPVVLALAGCGGGGDEPALPPPSPAQSADAAAATCGLSDFQAQVMARVNQWRANGANCGPQGSFGPAPALEWHAGLMVAAAAHSRDMQSKNFFSHTGSDGSTVGTRVQAAGYAWSTVGENIAAGQTSVLEVVDGWVASPGHCANLMNANFRHVAVACVPGGTQNSFRSYWTMNLARPR